MPADLDQFRGDNSHRAIVGGKGFVQLGHHPADSGRFFNQIYVIAGISHVQGGLHSGDTTPDDHGGTDYFFGHKHFSPYIADIPANATEPELVL
jgi:hypothetical protein